MTSPRDGDYRDGAAIPPKDRGADGSRLFGRSLLYVAVWSLQLIAGSVVSPVLAYKLGPSEFGALASAIAIYQVFTVFALLGIDQAVMLQRSEDSEDRAARGLISVGIVIAFAMSLVLALTAPLWRDALGFTTHAGLVYAVLLWTAPAAAVQVMLALLVTEDRFKTFAIIGGVAAVGGQIVGIALLFFVHDDATTYAWGGIASQFMAMMIGIAVTRPRIAGLVNWRIAATAIRLGIPLVFNGLSYFVLNAGDRVIIQAVLGTVQVGRYQIAYVVGSVVLILLGFVSSAWTPRFAQQRDERARWALAEQSRNELYRLLVPSILGITLGAPLMLRLVAPASFQPDGLLLVVFLVALSAFPVTASGATSRLLITHRRTVTLGVNSAVAAVMNIILNLVLVPVIGIVGSALATLVSFSLLAVLNRLRLPWEPRWHPAPTGLIVAMIGAAGLSAASVLLPQTEVWNIGRAVVALACLPWFIVRLKRARQAAPAPEAQASTEAA